MNRFKQAALKVLAAVIALVSLVLFSASSPALATDQRSLPSGDALYAFPCHHPRGEPALELLSTVDSTWTTVASAQGISDTECAYQPAFNPATGKSYFLGGNTTSNRWPLIEVVTSNGSMNIVHNIQTSAGDLEIAWGTNYPGNILINNEGAAFFVGGKTLYPLNLVTGMLGLPVNSTPWSSLAGDVYATACSPVAVTCYILTENGDLHTVNVANGTVSTSLGNIGVTGNYSLQVDSEGTLWSSSQDGKLASFQASNPGGTMILGASFPQYSGALLITSQSATNVSDSETDLLANTGDDWVSRISLASALMAIGFFLLRRKPSTQMASNK